MFETINRYWRILGTGMAFVVVGVGGVVVFPAMNLLIRNRTLRVVVARRVIGLTFRFIVGFMRVLGVFRYEISGLQRLQQQGLLILANHPTLIDVVFLMAFVRRADCIVKSRLWRNPFMNATVRAAGYIRNDDDGVELIRDCVAALRNGSNLIVFPEGTRTPSDGSIKFKRGAANIAVRASCNVTPVIIRCVPPMLTKGEKWWRLPTRRSQFCIEIKEEIQIASYGARAGSDSLAARQLTDYLQQYFTEEYERDFIVGRRRNQAADHRCASTRRHYSS